MAKKAMVDAARLADELRGEQDVAQCHEKDRKLLECQSKDMQVRLDEAETNALKGGKKAMNKMETRIRSSSPRWTPKAGGPPTPRRTFAGLSAASRSWHLPVTRTARSTSACRA